MKLRSYTVYNGPHGAEIAIVSILPKDCEGVDYAIKLAQTLTRIDLSPYWVVKLAVKMGN